MLVEDALPACPGDPCELLVRVFECIERFLGGIGDEDFHAGAQEAIEPLPRVAQQRRAARGGLEQAAGRAISHGGHFGPGHIERQPRGAEKPGMPVGGHVTDEPQVICPGKVVGIAGAAQHETLAPPAPGGLDEQPLQLDLPVVGIGAEIGEIRTPPRIAANGMVGQRIDVSVHGRDSPGAQQRPQRFQCSAAGVAEHQVEIAQPAGGQILHELPGIHSRQRNRGIQVIDYVERGGRRIEAQPGSDVGIGAVRCNDRRVRAGDLPRRHGRNRGPVAVKHQLRARKAREVPMCGAGAKRFLLGSVPNKVSHHAPCSVLIVRTT